MSFIPEQLIWWITAVDIPLVTAFLVTLNRLRQTLETRMQFLHEQLTAYKLEVAQNYASINHVKDLESRVIAHLLRIENKLDNTVYRNSTLKDHSL